MAGSLRRRFAALIAIGDRADDSEEEKLAHHYLVAMGVFAGYGGDGNTSSRAAATSGR